MAMKKLYKKKGQVHPSPPSIADYLGLLPAAIFTLTASLSPADKEVLAYLISCSGNQKDVEKGRGGDHQDGSSGKDDHLPVFQCDCFRCYMSFWARWDASANRHVIHEIIEAYEEELVRKKKKKKRSSKGKKERRKGLLLLSDLEDGEEALDMDSGKGLEKEEKVADGDGEGDEEGDEVGIEKGSSMRRFVSFLGERLWGVWNMG